MTNLELLKKELEELKEIYKEDLTDRPVYLNQITDRIVYLTEAIRTLENK